MFDLEGMPPQLDELDKIYLWGAQVFGENPSEFKVALSGFGADGDRKGWIAFDKSCRGRLGAGASPQDRTSRSSCAGVWLERQGLFLSVSPSRAFGGNL